MYISSLKSLKTIYSALIFLVVSICPVFAYNVVRSVKVNVMLDSLSEREIPEMALWNEYMVYATVFGVADKVLKQQSL